MYKGNLFKLCSNYSLIIKITNGISFATVYFFFALIPYFGSSIGIFLITILSLILGNGNQFLVVLMFQ